MFVYVSVCIVDSTFMSVMDHGRLTQPSLLTLISCSSSPTIPMGEMPVNPISVLTNSLVVMKCS